MKKNHIDLQLEQKDKTNLDLRLEFTNNVIFEMEKNFNVSIAKPNEDTPMLSIRGYIGTGLLKHHRQIALNPIKLDEVVMLIMEQYDMDDLISIIMEMLTGVLNVLQNNEKKKKVAR